MPLKKGAVMIVKVIENIKTTIYTDVVEHWVEREPDETAASFTMHIKHGNDQTRLVSLDLKQHDRIKTYTDAGVLLEDVTIDLTYMPRRTGDL